MFFKGKLGALLRSDCRFILNSCHSSNYIWHGMFGTVCLAQYVRHIYAENSNCFLAWFTNQTPHILPKKLSSTYHLTWTSLFKTVLQSSSHIATL